MKKLFEEINDSIYKSEDGWQLAREEGLTPNGNQIRGRWVLRDPAGTWIDFDQYRHDIAAMHSLQLIHLNDS